VSIDVSATLGDLVTQDPRRSRVLETFGLDYCCNGHRSLSEAVSAAELDLAEVSGALDLPAPPEGVKQVPAENAALAHDIVDTHHAYMWAEMPRLKALVDKVHGVHGDRHPELAGVAAAYTKAVTALDPHMTTEERVVFPAITRMEKTQTAGASLADQISELRAEHDAVGDLLKEIRSLTNDYAVPADACASYKMMLSGLEEMELDLHEHIHKENNVLFPRVLELEAQLGG
jgi:regulator of cell morphogenesis and NO signaling